MERMILVDARTIGPQLSGIGRYTLNLLLGIDAVSDAPPPTPVRVWVRPDQERYGVLPEAVTRSGALDLIEKNGSPQSSAHLLHGRRELRRLGVDLVHCPDVFIPWGVRCRRVVTLHDVIPLVCRGQLKKSRKQKYAGTWRAWMKMQARAAIRSGGGVVTVSHYSRSDIQRQLGLPPQHLHVIHNAVPPPPEVSTAHAEDQAGAGREVFRGLGIRGPFVLNVGRRDPYKNVDGLVRAFDTMRRRFSDLPPDLQLVIAGHPDPRYPEAEREAQRLNLGDAVVFTGYIDDATLHVLYRSAAVLAMPSFYEGFGLPAVEAMRAGTPVVAGAVASMPEVVGDAALLFDAHRPDALAEAMHKVLVDQELAKILVERGADRAKHFTIEKFGAAHLELYGRLLAN